MFNPCCSGSNWLCMPVPMVPPPPIPPPSLIGPIRGDVSGNPAAPGNVGEFIQRTISGTLTVPATNNVVTTITPLTLGPGDWDLRAWLSISMIFNGAVYWLNPSIPGTSDSMTSGMFLPGAVNPVFSLATLQSPRVQFLTAAAATVLQFNITVVNTSAASETGQYFFTINARRMR